MCVPARRVNPTTNQTRRSHFNVFLDTPKWTPLLGLRNHVNYINFSKASENQAPAVGKNRFPSLGALKIMPDRLMVPPLLLVFVR